MKKRIPAGLISISFLWAVTLVRNDPVIGQRRGGAKRDVVSLVRWYVFTGPDGDFRLAFPSKPSLEAAGQGPVTVIREFGATTDYGMRFSVNFQDMGGDPRASQNNEWGRELEEMSAAADREQGIRLIQTHRLARNIVETEVWQSVATTGNINYLRRSIIRRGRVYVLACGSVIAGRSVDKSICHRFFNSMRFMH